ncbi:MAG: AMP-dependent synthetase and ligase [Acidimicrobiales bacterium]|nr:AMP-dependent synthetase and ligase [Acidimicrobiales bacterium]
MTAPPNPAPWATIGALVEDAIARFPDLEAVVEGGERWTFRSLGDRIHEAARALIASGVAPGDRVSVWAPNIREWVVISLAIHSVGAVLVPINTRFKGGEAAYVLRKAKVRRVFTVTDFLDVDYVEVLRSEADLELDEIVVLRGPSHPGATSWEDFVRRGADVDDAERTARVAAVSGEDPCHILFTSGTTGAPKGAVLGHAAVCTAYSVYADNVGLRTGDRYLIVLPFFHSFGLNAGILVCLMAGATIVAEPVFDVESVLERIVEERITAFPGAPTVYQTLLAAPAATREKLTTLRLAVVSSAAIPVEMIRQMSSVLKIDTIITGYGLTEASGIVAMCRHGDDPEVIAQTAGRTVEGMTIRIADEAGNELPAEVAGEVLVRGYTVMQGYFDDPEQTAQTIDAEGWLHTGDIGMIRADGNLVITDRMKDMYIVGGFNTYPAEIENVMSTHPAIAAVAVVGVPDERLGEVGSAFVIPASGVAADPDEIMAWCRGRMANYKVPRHVHVVEDFPLNATGKVLKFKLRVQARDMLAPS